MAIKRNIVSGITRSVARPITVQLGALLNLRLQLDNYLNFLASSLDSTKETIDITAITKYASVYRTIASNQAMLDLQAKNKLIVVNEKLNSVSMNGTFENSGAGWGILGESTVNTGVGRIYSSVGSISAIYAPAVQSVGIFYRLFFDVSSFVSGSVSVGNTALKYVIESDDNGNNIPICYEASEVDLFFKRAGACDISIDNVSLNTVFNNFYVAMGDSITTGDGYAYDMAGERNYLITDRAVAGNGIVNNFLDHVASTASDTPDLITIMLGSNDNNGGDMSVLKTTAITGINQLKIYHPNAKIYWINVLPRWYDLGGVEDYKDNIRTAVEEACRETGIPCIDTYTNPWITVDDTIDGVHPTADGHDKIYARLSPLLPLLY